MCEMCVLWFHENVVWKFKVIGSGSCTGSEFSGECVDVMDPDCIFEVQIAKTGIVTKQQRDQAWDELQAVAVEGKKRPFCRAVDGKGLMYSGNGPCRIT